MINMQSQFRNFFGSAALPALDEIFFDMYEQAQDPRSKLFNMESTDREILQKGSMASLGLMSSIGEGEQSPRDNFSQSYNKTYTMLKYSKSIGITDEMIADDRYDLVKKMIQSGARSAKETELVLAMNVFNNAFSAETSYDGVAIISASHPSLVGNQSNTLSAASDISYSSLAELEKVFRSFQDHRGKKLLIKPRVLLVSESDRHAALEIVQSPYKANTANNNINALGVDGGLELISSPYLTDPDAWFLLADPMDHGLRVIDRQKLSTKSWEDVSQGVLNYKFEYRQAVGCDEWRGIAGTAGA